MTTTIAGNRLKTGERLNVYWPLGFNTEDLCDFFNVQATIVAQMEKLVRLRPALLAEEEDPSGLRFRVQVSGGGCSGFQYGFCFDDARNEDDHVFVHNGIEVVVDGVSLDLLDRAEIDYVEELIGASFQVRNPNAVSSCGCGSSFSIG